MNRLVIVLVFVASVRPDGFGYSRKFLMNDFADSYTTVLEDYLNARRCRSVFEPYFTYFEYKNTTHLLLIDDGWISQVPRIKRVGDALWFGNSTYMNILIVTDSSDYAVSYSGYVGQVIDHQFNSISCHITASGSGFTVSSVRTLVKNYKGLDYIYIYPAENWALLYQKRDIEKLGSWDFVVTCPGADQCLIDEVEAVIRRLNLVRLRDVMLKTGNACPSSILAELELADYFTYAPVFPHSRQFSFPEHQHYKSRSRSYVEYNPL